MVIQFAGSRKKQLLQVAGCIYFTRFVNGITKFGFFRLKNGDFDFKNFKTFWFKYIPKEQANRYASVNRPGIFMIFILSGIPGTMYLHP